ncbi:MAG: FMN-binding protein [Lachnospiraceae bacterium]|nr:FMN-binding protein [Lachnospiraceae bacterium]
MKNKKSDLGEMLKNAGILFAITLIAGLALGFVSELTKEPIAYQQELKIQKACAAVFAEADSFEEMLIKLPEDIILDPAASGTEAQVYPEEVLIYAEEHGTQLGTVYQALSAQGDVLGYVINVTTHDGYGGDIVLMMGVKMDGAVSGISILEIAETPGLGMQAGAVLVPQFAGKLADSFTYTKTGATAENEIDAISGATITTEAVTNAVNTGLFYFQTAFKEGGNQ